MRKVLHDYATGDTLDVAAKRHGTTAQTLRNWALDDQEAFALYARARNISAGHLEDEALSVARASTATTSAADRVLVDTLKWAAAKRYPKEYGDRQMNESTGTVTVRVIRADAPSIEGRVSMQEQARIPAQTAYPDAVITDAEISE